MELHYLLREIDKHWEKLKRISKLDDNDILESQRLIYKNIDFIDEGQIPKKYRVQAYDLVKDIDLNDMAFVALNLDWHFYKKLNYCADCRCAAC